MRTRLLVPILIISALALGAMSCGGGSGSPHARVTIEPLLASPTPRLVSGPIGGKPAAPPQPPQYGVPQEATTESEETPSPPEQEATTEVLLTETPTPVTLDGSVAPTEGRWIEVDVTKYVVRLMDGASVVNEISPVGVGEQIDTGEYISTQTGLFAVQNKIEELAYDPPYDTYISHWVAFDPDRANGFHSLLKDEIGTVVDASTGRVSNGCIRSAAATQIFEFAEVGMPVWVHW